MKKSSYINALSNETVNFFKEFKNKYEDAIVLSNQPHCDDEIKQLGEDRAKQLNHSTNCFILRRTQSIINQYLPSKQECVVFCSLNLMIFGKNIVNVTKI